MILVEDYIDLSTPSGLMRTHRFAPPHLQQAPGLILYSEIYQMTGPIARTARFLAGHGYIVLVPEVYHEFEPLGTALAYDTEGTDRGNRYKIEKPLQSFDNDTRAIVEAFHNMPQYNGQLGSIGMCLGGHLAFRAAFYPEIRAAVSLFATDIHKASLGKGQNDDSLQRSHEITGELCMIWGKQDRHISREGRELIHKQLLDSSVNVTWHEFNAQHAFLRDEGHRYNPALAQLCMSIALELFHRKLQLKEPLDVPLAKKTA